MFDDFVKGFYGGIGKPDILLCYKMFYGSVFQVLIHGLVAIFASPAAARLHRVCHVTHCNLYLKFLLVIVCLFQKRDLKTNPLQKTQPKLQYFNYLSIVNGKMNKKSNQQSLTE